MPGFVGRPGLLRFAIPSMAGQITWLFPLAILGALTAAFRAPGRWPRSPEHASLLLWSGWFATHWLVFSFAQGIFHKFYLIHQPLVIIALALFRPLHLTSWAQTAAVSTVSVAAALVLYEAIVRPTPLVQLFGSATPRRTGVR
jgi:hypothetical protein